MPASHQPSWFRQRPSFVLLCVLLLGVWIAGGSSRADALGQVVVRAVAWVLLVVWILVGAVPKRRETWPVLAMLAIALLIALVQLIPLPPSIWLNLPGRAVLAEASRFSGQAQPWRPTAIVPGAAVNAASSLVIPIATFLFAADLGADDRRRLPGVVLGLIGASALIGVLQFSGATFGNRLVNDRMDAVSGLFANRNHFALFLAIGCLVAPAWAFLGDRQPRWRGPVALASMLIFALVILASGSRVGLLLGAVAICLGLFLVRDGIRRALGRAPRWAFPTLILGVVGLIAAFVLVSVAADRAVAVNRALQMDAGQDVRVRALPTVLAIIRIYFPVGAGFGGFDPIFRINEPFDLLKPTYFNHAHDDFLEVLVDAGLPGALLLLSGLTWWAAASVRAWRAGPGGMLSRLGSSALLLVIIASAFDYPARTPLMMSIAMLAAVWLCEADATRTRAALPVGNSDL